MAAPDRFKDQAPVEGGRAAVLQWIADMQRGAPNYERMSPQLARTVRPQVSRLHAMLAALGPVESTFFRGVGPGGYDIYGAKFSKGLAEFRLLLGPDGITEDMVFRPDGDDTPGGVVACSDEPSLKSPLDTAPIKLLLYNGSGADIHAFGLDFEGKRAREIIIGEERTAPIMTHVGRPWVIADAAGRCLEIVLPGQGTRHLVVQLRKTGEYTTRSDARRTTPMPGSEEALRRYIVALGRGEPNYGQMTADAAAETRRHLPLNQAILMKFGALRAITFRAVSPLGNDVYVVHFANGSAEWRIGLAKDGRIGRVALGPQS
jgi:hypothetical protein